LLPKPQNPIINFEEFEFLNLLMAQNARFAKDY